jgi:hypothetical protein
MDGESALLKLPSLLVRVFRLKAALQEHSL